MLLGQCFGAMRIIGGLREVGTSSCGSGGNELEARFRYAMVRTLLMAALACAVQTVAWLLVTGSPLPRAHAHLSLIHI